MFPDPSILMSLLPTSEIEIGARPVVGWNHATALPR